MEGQQRHLQNHQTSQTAITLHLYSKTMKKDISKNFASDSVLVYFQFDKIDSFNLVNRK